MRQLPRQRQHIADGVAGRHLTDERGHAVHLALDAGLEPGALRRLEQQIFPSGERALVPCHPRRFAQLGQRITPPLGQRIARAHGQESRKRRQPPVRQVARHRQGRRNVDRPTLECRDQFRRFRIHILQLHARKLPGETPQGRRVVVNP